MTAVGTLERAIPRDHTSDCPTTGLNLRTVLRVRKRSDWRRVEFFRWLDATKVKAGYPHDAALSKATGVSQSTLSNWRNGKQRPTNDNLTKIANGLGVEPLWVWQLAGLVPAGAEPTTTEADAAEPTPDDADLSLSLSDPLPDEPNFTDPYEQRLWTRTQGLPLPERRRYILRLRAERIIAEAGAATRHKDPA